MCSPQSQQPTFQFHLVQRLAAPSKQDSRMSHPPLFLTILCEEEIPALFHSEDQAGVSHQILYGETLPIS
jgi:hypothetical protein